MPTPPTPWLVACLCAAWCRTCEDYRTVFDDLAQAFGPEAEFRWVDIEDDEQALGELDIVDFPTLLIAEGDTVRFLGPVLPHPQTARQLVERARRGELPAVAQPGPAGLPAQIRRLPGR